MAGLFSTAHTPSIFSKCFEEKNVSVFFFCVLPVLSVHNVGVSRGRSVVAAVGVGDRWQVKCYRLFCLFVWYGC